MMGVVGIFGGVLLCVIYGVMVENILFEDGDVVNIFCVFILI